MTKNTEDAWLLERQEYWSREIDHLIKVIALRRDDMNRLPIERTKTPVFVWVDVQNNSDGTWTAVVPTMVLPVVKHTTANSKDEAIRVAGREFERAIGIE